MTDILHLKFENIQRPVALIDCRELAEHFPLIFSGWRIVELDDYTQTPIITLSLEDSRYHLNVEWLDKTQRFSDKVDAICGLLAKIVLAYVMHDSNKLCLHGAAVEMGGKLVVFPSKYRAGKSVLSVCLAASKVNLFCDDVLPINLTERYGIGATFSLFLPIYIFRTLSMASK